MMHLLSMTMLMVSCRVLIMMVIEECVRLRLSILLVLRVVVLRARGFGLVIRIVRRSLIEVVRVVLRGAMDELRL